MKSSTFILLLTILQIVILAVLTRSALHRNSWRLRWFMRMQKQRPDLHFQLRMGDTSAVDHYPCPHCESKLLAIT